MQRTLPVAFLLYIEIAIKGCEPHSRYFMFTVKYWFHKRGHHYARIRNTKRNWTKEWKQKINPGVSWKNCPWSEIIGSS